MKNLNEQIKELEKLANQEVPNGANPQVQTIRFEMFAEKTTAIKALEIIKHLQDEVDRYKTLWEANMMQSGEIIIELENRIKKLEENVKI